MGALTASHRERFIAEGARPASQRDEGLHPSTPGLSANTVLQVAHDPTQFPHHGTPDKFHGGIPPE